MFRAHRLQVLFNKICEADEDVSLLALAFTSKNLVLIKVTVINALILNKKTPAQNWHRNYYTTRLFDDEKGKDLNLGYNPWKGIPSIPVLGTFCLKS